MLISGWFFIPDDYCPVYVKRDGDKISINIPVLPETVQDDLVYAWNKIASLKKCYLGGRRNRIATTKLKYLELAKQKTIIAEECKKYGEKFTYALLADLEEAKNQESVKREMSSTKKGIQLTKVVKKQKGISPINAPLFNKEEEKFGTTTSGYWF